MRSHKRKGKVGKRTLKAMADARSKGMSYRQIGKRLGLTKSCVEWWLTRRFKKKPESRWKLAMEERNEHIVTLAMQGRNLKAVARLVGSNYQAVWKIARRYGVRLVTDVKHERARQWARRHDAGESFASIARSAGLPRSTVHSAVERLRRNAG